MASPIAGAYITFSDLFDRQPTAEEVISLMKDLPMIDAVILLSRVNLALRFAIQEQNRPNFGRVQQILIKDFCDDEVFSCLVDRFPRVDTAERPIFIPLVVLNVLRLTLAYSRPTEEPSAEDNSRLRFAIGRACLMMNNLLLTAAEEREIQVGPPDDRRLSLMVQMLAPFEVANPPAAHHLMFRFQVMFRAVLKDPAVRARIARECSGFDFEVDFEKLVGIQLERWVYIMFSVYTYFLRGGNLFDVQLQYSVLHPSAFPTGSGISQRELDAVLQTVTASSATLRSELVAEISTDPRFDFIPFRSKPLIGINQGRFAPIDIAFILEKVHTGLHWSMHDALPREKRNALFQAWGVLFEEYVHWILRGMNTRLSVKYVPSPQWEVGGESFDGIIMKDAIFLPMEYKGGFLARAARYSGNKAELLKDLEEKFVPGCKQLARKIRALFAENPTERKHLRDITLEHVRAVIPVLVLQDQILRTPFMNWYLNRMFQSELRGFIPRGDLAIRPLTVVNVNELETIAESAEAADFDFVYALHHRTVRDENVLSPLQEWLMQFAGYGRTRSPRVKRVLDEMKSPLFDYLFPKQD